MACRTLQITVIDAKDIKDVNRLSRMSVYAVVTVSGAGVWKQELRTPEDKDCGTCPSWKHTLKFNNLHVAALTSDEAKIEIKLVSARTFNRHKEIGEAVVPAKVLLQNEQANGEKPVIYPVVTPTGETKGEVRFAYKFVEANAGSGSAHPSPWMAPPVNPQYPPQPQPGYGYPPVVQPGYGQRPQRPLGGNVALGLEAVSSALLVGDIISNLGGVAAADAWYDDEGGDGLDY